LYLEVRACWLSHMCTSLS